MRLLLANGADASLENSNRVTPLMHAAGRGQPGATLVMFKIENDSNDSKISVSIPTE